MDKSFAHFFVEHVWVLLLVSVVYLLQILSSIFFLSGSIWSSIHFVGKKEAQILSPIHLWCRNQRTQEEFCKRFLALCGFDPCSSFFQFVQVTRFFFTVCCCWWIAILVSNCDKLERSLLLEWGVGFNDSESSRVGLLLKTVAAAAPDGSSSSQGHTVPLLQEVRSDHWNLKKKLAPHLYYTRFVSAIIPAKNNVVSTVKIRVHSKMTASILQV